MLLVAHTADAAPTAWLVPCAFCDGALPVTPISLNFLCSFLLMKRKRLLPMMIDNRIGINASSIWRLKFSRKFDITKVLKKMLPISSPSSYLICKTFFHWKAVCLNRSVKPLLLLPNLQLLSTSVTGTDFFWIPWPIILTLWERVSLVVMEARADCATLQRGFAS